MKKIIRIIALAMRLHMLARLMRVCRTEQAQVYLKQKQEIMDDKSSDVALFHRLIMKQRGKLGACVNELHVENEIYKTESEILSGWHRHFGQLAEKKKIYYLTKNLFLSKE